MVRLPFSALQSTVLPLRRSRIFASGLVVPCRLEPCKKSFPLALARSWICESSSDAIHPPSKSASSQKFTGILYKEDSIPEGLIVSSVSCLWRLCPHCSDKAVQQTRYVSAAFQGPWYTSVNAGRSYVGDALTVDLGLIPYSYSNESYSTGLVWFLLTSCSYTSWPLSIEISRITMVPYMGS